MNSTYTGWLLIPTDTGVDLAPGWVRVINGIITEVNTAGFAERVEFGDDSTLILPGLIDCHLHIPQFPVIGAGGLPLLTWLAQVVFPEEAKWADADYAEAVADLAATRLLSVGTGAISAFATGHAEATQRAINVMGRRGLRGFVGQSLMDRECPPELARPAMQLLREAAKLEQCSGIYPIITPRFAISCSPELLHGAGALARKLGQPVQTHLAETRPELERIAELFGDEPYTAIYDRFGLLGPRSLLAHCIYLSPEEQAIINRSGSVAAHCPTANTFLQSGLMNKGAMEQAAVRLALGSDIGGGYERSMVRVARAMVETARIVALESGDAEAVPSAAQAWRMITRGNAEALGLADAGRIEPGVRADLVIARPDPEAFTSPDPLGFLLHAWDDRWITATLLQGDIAHGQIPE